MAIKLAVKQYHNIMIKAYEYHKQALWQEKLQLLQEAMVLVNEPSFPDREMHEQQLLYDLGGIRRRLGQYDLAEGLLKQSFQACPDASPIKRSNILGELAVVLRHSNRFEEARDASREAYHIAQNAPPSLEADAELCRAIGNEGVTSYNMSQLPKHAKDRSTLLAAAFSQLQERIERARALQERLSVEDPSSRMTSLAKSWEIIGMDRLTLCHIAAAQYPEAVAVAEDSQRRQTRVDPTVTAISKFIYGNALWHAGYEAGAREQWRAPVGTCSSLIALCKELSQEYLRYIQLMANAGTDFDSYDEQGFSALDYAVLSGGEDGKAAVPIIVQALRRQLDTSISRDAFSPPRPERKGHLDGEISRRLHQAELRRHYRTLLQDRVRPVLSGLGDKSFAKLRKTYATYLAIDGGDQQHILGRYHFLQYTDFKAFGKVTTSLSDLVKPPQHENSNASAISKRDVNDVVVFISYRWISDGRPDDGQNTQWKRIMNALDRFLEHSPHVQPEQLGLWLDYACIDQVNLEQQQRGIDALPLAVLLCDAMISLVDSAYYTRAWCVVEVMLMQALIKSYGVHQWWEHILESPDIDRSLGFLRRGVLQQNWEPDHLTLSKEVEDRPKIDFLIRQSKLLGKGEV